MTDVQIIIPKPFPAQQVILEQAKRNNFLLLSRRWGKTTLTSAILKKKALMIEKFRGAWSAPTWKLMMETFEEYRESLFPAISRINREDRRIELINGSVIEFWSSDDIQAGRGRKYHYWVADEMQRQRNIAKFIKGSVRPTLADYRGTLFILGTANGEGSEFHDFYLECQNDPSRWYLATGNLEQNPYIHPDEIAQMRRDLGPDLSAQEIDSLWVRVDGIAPLIRPFQWEQLYAQRENTKQRSKVLAVDASINNDKTALVGVWEDYDGHYCIDYSDIMLIEPDPDTFEIDYVRLEQLLIQLWSTGTFHTFAYDPYQMVSLAQRLRSKGIRTTEFTQNSMRLKSDGYLRQLCNEGRLHHPDHPDLTQHMLSATMKYTQNGFRIVKASKDQKIDLAVALSMACWTLKETKSRTGSTFTPVTDGQRLTHDTYPVKPWPADYVKDMGINPWKK